MRIDLSQILVMVVDDNKFIRHVVHEMLHSFNVGHIVEAESGADALDKFKVTRPDIILCDWMMHPMTGIELVREVRAGNTPIDKQTPVIMLTGQIDASHVLQARDVGVNAYVAKPLSVEGMMTRLVDVIRSTATVGHA